MHLKTMDESRGRVMFLQTLDEGRSVGDWHGAIIRDRQQLICGHGESVSVLMVTEGADRKVQEVQLSVSQALPEDYG